MYRHPPALTYLPSYLPSLPRMTSASWYASRLFINSDSLLWTPSQMEVCDPLGLRSPKLSALFWMWSGKYQVQRGHFSTIRIMPSYYSTKKCIFFQQLDHPVGQLKLQVYTDTNFYESRYPQSWTYEINVFKPKYKTLFQVNFIFVFWPIFPGY